MRSVRSQTCSIRSSAARAVLRNARTRAKPQYGLPMGQKTNHIHVWNSLRERAGFSLADIPKETPPSTVSRQATRAGYRDRDLDTLLWTFNPDFPDESNVW
jgi:hypothetical protein